MYLFIPELLVQTDTAQNIQSLTIVTTTHSENQLNRRTFLHRYYAYAAGVCGLVPLSAWLSRASFEWWPDAGSWDRLTIPGWSTARTCQPGLDVRDQHKPHCKPSAASIHHPFYVRNVLAVVKAMSVHSLPKHLAWNSSADPIIFLTFSLLISMRTDLDSFLQIGSTALSQDSCLSLEVSVSLPRSGVPSLAKEHQSRAGRHFVIEEETLWMWKLSIKL